ncbi:MAG: hypothetical protein ABEI53_02720 [Candidatus Magasanikbacteria bacterium]
MTPVEKISKVLGAKQDKAKKVNERLSEVTQKRNVLKKVIENIERKIEKRLGLLGLDRSSSVEKVINALLEKAEEDSRQFADYFNNPEFGRKGGGYEKVLEVTKNRTAAQDEGFFLKKEIAADFLRNEPPKNVLEYLGYSSAEEMLSQEDLLEVYSSLRFLESRDWMNKKFFEQYKRLTPDDFERREIELKILGKKWAEAGEDFVASKWHNVSHLKELGFIFVLPVEANFVGQLMRTVGLVSHYLHEVPFYSNMFEKISEEPSTFDNNLRSLLRGDVVDKEIEESGEEVSWLVVQRYLVKDDESDWRLKVPRINPEAHHYLRAEEALIRMAEDIEKGGGLSFWKGLDWVGGFFENSSGKRELVSFNMMDNAFSLVRRSEKIRYTYHQREALWNRLFMDYFSRSELEDYLQKYLLRGYFKI